MSAVIKVTLVSSKWQHFTKQRRHATKQGYVDLPLRKALGKGGNTATAWGQGMGPVRGLHQPTTTHTLVTIQTHCVLDITNGRI